MGNIYRFMLICILILISITCIYTYYNTNTPILPDRSLDQGHIMHRESNTVQRMDTDIRRGIGVSEIGLLLLIIVCMLYAVLVKIRGG